jgi:predicted transcriptional regulator
VTDFISGFLGPEENAARQRRHRGQQDPAGQLGQPGQPPGAYAPPGNLSLAILAVLRSQGPTKLTELPAKVHDKPRKVWTMVDELENSGMVRVSGQGAEEIAELTDEGRQTLPTR